jgi:hypothetical protein
VFPAIHCYQQNFWANSAPSRLCLHLPESDEWPDFEGIPRHSRSRPRPSSARDPGVSQGSRSPAPTSLVSGLVAWARASHCTHLRAQSAYCFLRAPSAYCFLSGPSAYCFLSRPSAFRLHRVHCVNCVNREQHVSPSLSVLKSLLTSPQYLYVQQNKRYMWICLRNTSVWELLEAAFSHYILITLASKVWLCGHFLALAKKTGMS